MVITLDVDHTSCEVLWFVTLDFPKGSLPKASLLNLLPQSFLFLDPGASNASSDPRSYPRIPPHRETLPAIAVYVCLPACLYVISSLSWRVMGKSRSTRLPSSIFNVAPFSLAEGGPKHQHCEKRPKGGACVPPPSHSISALALLDHMHLTAGGFWGCFHRPFYFLFMTQLVWIVPLYKYNFNIPQSPLRRQIIATSL